MDLDEKYRPRTLDRIIGHEAVVDRLRGIIKSKKWPKALLFTGPSSAGKTTLARAFTADMFGVKTLKGNPDFHELNSADARGIDDMRSTMRLARLRPRAAPRRVFMMDEAQGFTGDAERLLLKPLEEPPPGTMFILGSMEPEKLNRAIKNRCQQFVLGAPDQKAMTKYVKRIIKGEGIDYMTDELTQLVVQNANGEMRSAANIMQAIMQTAEARGKISSEDVLRALDSVETKDEVTAVEVLSAVYNRKLSVMYRKLLDVENGFAFINKLLTLNRFLINNTVLKGEKHRAVWWSESNKTMHGIVKKVFEEGKVDGKALHVLTMVQNELVDLKRESGAFAVLETDAIGYRLSHAIAALSRIFKESK